MTRVILFLLLGAIVNVTVAWGCAFWTSTLGIAPLLEDDEASAIWHELALARWQEPPTYEGVRGITSMGATTGIVSGVSTLDEEVGIETSVIWADHGLPFRSMRSVIWLENWNVIGEKRFVMFRRSFPLAAIWPGFAINTLFYAAILWLLFAVPFALRRRLRIKRGLCPACAYPTGDSAVCTECGKALPRPSSRSFTCSASPDR